MLLQNVHISFFASFFFIAIAFYGINQRLKLDQEEETSEIYET